MKIAKTITSACLDILPGRPHRRRLMEKTTAAHLAPIREALESASDFIEGTAQHGDICESRDGGACDCGLHTAMLHVQEALALMEEER